MGTGFEYDPSVEAQGKVRTLCTNIIIISY